MRLLGWCLMFAIPLFVGGIWSKNKQFFGDVPVVVSVVGWVLIITFRRFNEIILLMVNPIRGSRGERLCTSFAVRTRIRPKSITGPRCRAAKDGRSAAGAEGKKQRDVTCKNRNYWRPPDVTNLWVKGFGFLIGHPSWRQKLEDFFGWWISFSAWKDVLGSEKFGLCHFGTLLVPFFFSFFVHVFFLCYQCSDIGVLFVAFSPVFFPGGSRSRFGICYALCGGGFWQEIRVLSGKPGLQVAAAMGWDGAVGYKHRMHIIKST